MAHLVNIQGGRNKTSLVYVLVSCPKDIFYEQTLISAWSARHWNPDMKILLVVDELTDAGLIGNRTALTDLVDEKIVIDLSEGGKANYTNKERSRILKSNLRSYVEGDILYIDSDTVVCGSLAETDSWEIPFGAVQDGHSKYDPKHCPNPVVQRAALIGYDVCNAENYFNSGVMYMKDCPEVRAFAKDWYRLYTIGQKRGVTYDQPSLLATDTIHNLIRPLDGIYNCQILNGGLPYLAEAKILHYYNILWGDSSLYALANPSLYARIKEYGILDDETKQMILSAKRQFVGEYALVYGRRLSYWHSSLHHLYFDSPKLFGVCEALSKVLLKIRRLYKALTK
jgi:hypothetical protein